MTRFEQVRELIAAVFTHQIVNEIPVSSPQTVELLANTLCEFMAGLCVVTVTDEELAMLTSPPEEDVT